MVTIQIFPDIYKKRENFALQILGSRAHMFSYTVVFCVWPAPLSSKCFISPLDVVFFKSSFPLSADSVQNNQGLPKDW